MGIGNDGGGEHRNPDDYSWLKVHWNNLKGELRMLVEGIIINFRRVTWHRGRDLWKEYLLVISILIFLALFFFAIYQLVSYMQ